MKINKIIITLFNIFILCASGLAEISDSIVDKYYEEMHTTDGTASINIGINLSTEFPDASQGELFAVLIDRADKKQEDYSVLCNVLTYLINKDPSFVWSAHLEKSLLALTKCPDVKVRAGLIRLLTMREKNKYQDLCIAFLDDPNDDVRNIAIPAVGYRANGRNILKKYIQDHDADPNYAKSVARAKKF